MANELEIAWTYPYASLNPKFEVGVVPGLVSTWPELEHLCQTYYDGITAEIMTGGLLEVGIRPVMFFGSNFMSIISSEPIRTPADAKGKKIRYPAAPMGTEALKRMGFIPTAIPAGEQYAAIESGVVDGAYGSPLMMQARQLQEVAGYVNNLNWMMDICVIGMPLELYNSLPKDIQEAIDKATSYAEPAAWTLNQIYNSQAIEFLESQGVTYYTLTEEERQAFFDLMNVEELWEEFIKPHLGEAKFAEYLAEAQRVREHY